MRKFDNKIWPYVVEIIPPPSDLIEIPWWYKTDQWCFKNIGKRFKDWYGYNLSSHFKRTYAFKDKETALVFSLIWRK